MRRLRLPKRSLAFIAVLAAALALEGWAPAPAWAPPPPRPRRWRPLPRRVVPRPVPVPVPAPKLHVAKHHQLRNLLNKHIVIKLPGPRVLTIPPLGTAPIAEADLSAPNVLKRIERGEVVLVLEKP